MQENFDVCASGCLCDSSALSDICAGACRMGVSCGRLCGSVVFFLKDGRGGYRYG